MTAQNTPRRSGLRVSIGAVGLLLTPIATVLLLMSLATDRHDALLLFAVVVVGLVLWGQSVGQQAGLPLLTTAAWMVTGVALFGVVLVAGLLAGALATGAGLPGSIVAVVLLSILSARLEAGSVRAATLRALWHAVMGRATDVDRAFLARGPSAIFWG